MASLQTLERRIAALEARLADVEGGYGETLYSLRRSAVRTDLRMGAILGHLGITDVTDDDIDHVSTTRTLSSHRSAFTCEF